jgi:hypothetical protein
MNHRQLHAAGIVENFSPKAARPKRELRRIVASIRRVLWRKPGTLALWVERDRRRAALHGKGFISWERLSAPYSGYIVAIGTRALLVLTGREPA